MKRDVLIAAVVAAFLSGPAFAKGGGRFGGGHKGGSHGSSGSHSSGGSHGTRGYTKKNGTYVAPSHATNPNNTKKDNWSSKGNTNPYTGKKGTKNPGDDK